jgi:DeoR/GlpR family transcriptional regulator of sugar metabolism
MSDTSTVERRNRLTHLLAAQGGVKVGELAARFGVSTETIRRDLLFLESKGIARKGHGGAVAAGALLELETPFIKKSLENTEAKAAIALAALALIPEGGVVFLDAGTTVHALARLLAQRSGLTVVTNSIQAAQVVAATGNELFFAGGRIRPSSQAAVGAWGREAFAATAADIAFLGADGIRLDDGPCTAAMEEAEIKAAMIRGAKRRILLCDAAKFGHRGLFRFCGWDDLDAVVTDAALAEGPRAALEGRVDLIVAG